MELIKKYQGFIAIGLAAVGLVALVALSSGDDTADTGKTDDAKTAQADKKDADKPATGGNKAASSTPYNYTAQAGDSYSVLARKAVQTYGINEKVQLTPAQIVAAETQLTVNAGSIELNEGQTVVLDKAAVKAAVDAAKKLDTDTLAAWEAYVPTVDFNTNAVGQSS